MKKIVFLLILTTTIVATGMAHSPSQKITSGILTEWMDLHCGLVRKASGISHVAYSRQFSYTAIAVYEGIVGNYSSNRSLAKQLNDLPPVPVTSKGELDQRLCINAVYAEMLRAFYSSFDRCKTIIDSMEKVQALRIVNTGVNKKVADNSARFGKAIAGHILQWANADGSRNDKKYIPVQGEGLWTPTTTAAAPFWFENRTITPNLLLMYFMTAPVYSTDTTAAFYKMAKEVYETGKNISEEQRKIALHWDDSPNGEYITVFGHWTSILSALIKQRGLSLIEASEAFAKMSIALHDASIIAWKGKYQYNVLRPDTYIQQHIDKSWRPLISTPPHPEFPAAHATLSYAAATALQTVFGSHCTVTDNTYTRIGMQERIYPSLQAAAREAGLSRLYGGIHYRYSIEQGFLIGEKVARYVDSSLSFHLIR